MKARLAIYKVGILVAGFPLPEPGTTIGRDEDNSIGLDHPKVSRHHAVVHAQDNMWVIKDLGSTNGIKVNGKKVKHAVLRQGDKVEIGPFEMVFETVAKNAEWKPPHGKDFSYEAVRRTISEEMPPGGPQTLQGGPQTLQGPETLPEDPDKPPEP